MYASTMALYGKLNPSTVSMTLTSLLSVPSWTDLALLNLPSAKCHFSLPSLFSPPVITACCPQNLPVLWLALPPSPSHTFGHMTSEKRLEAEQIWLCNSAKLHSKLAVTFLCFAQENTHTKFGWKQYLIDAETQMMGIKLDFHQVLYGSEQFWH